MPNNDTQELAAAEESVHVQHELTAELEAEVQADEADLEDKEDAERAARGDANTTPEWLAHLRQTREAAERKCMDSRGALEHAKARLAERVAQRDRIRTASAGRRDEEATARLMECCETLHSRTSNVLDAWLPYYTEFETLQRAQTQTYRELMQVRGQVPRNVSPTIDEIGRRWPGLLNKVAALAQLARFGGLPLSPSGTAAAPQRSAALQRLRQGT